MTNLPAFIPRSKTATIVKISHPQHWSPGVTQMKTHVKIDDHIMVFSSIQGNIPNVFGEGEGTNLDETCLFLGDMSDVIGDADLDVEKYLHRHGYDVTVALDNSIEAD